MVHRHNKTSDTEYHLHFSKHQKKFEGFFLMEKRKKVKFKNTVQHLFFKESLQRELPALSSRNGTPSSILRTTLGFSAWRCHSCELGLGASLLYLNSCASIRKVCFYSISKTTAFALLTTLKPLTGWTTTNGGKFFKRCKKTRESLGLQGDWVKWSHSVVSDSLRPHGIFQARILEWVAISFSRRSSQPRDWTRVIVGRCFTVWATREVPRRSNQSYSTRSDGLNTTNLSVIQSHKKDTGMPGF